MPRPSWWWLGKSTTQTKVTPKQPRIPWKFCSILSILSKVNHDFLIQTHIYTNSIKMNHLATLYGYWKFFFHKYTWNLWKNIILNADVILQPNPRTIRGATHKHVLDPSDSALQSEMILVMNTYGICERTSFLMQTLFSSQMKEQFVVLLTNMCWTPVTVCIVQ